MVSETNILQTDFEGVGEIFFTENKYLSWRIMLEKNLTPLYVGEKHLSLACEHALQGTLVAGLWSIRVQTIENCCRFVF